MTMRVSTGMIFDAGIGTINRQTADLLHLQQQVATGRRILTPSDDPVNAARALVVQQSMDVTAQYTTNQDNAKSALGLEEAQLTGVGELFTRIKELTVQAGNPALSGNDRRSTAQELRARFDELLGIANAADGTGQYLFSGYMGSTKPFGATVDAFLQNASATEAALYQGDAGQRRLQISATRYLEVSDAGDDVFTRIKTGNGYFTTGYNATNTGTGIIDIGNVTDPAKWNALANKNYRIDFTVDSSVTPSVTYYDIVDTTSGNSLLTGGAAPAAQANQRVYQSGQPILLKNQGAEPAFDLGGSVTITGEPATGDDFSLAPSANQSVFQSLAKLIGTLESSLSDAAATARYNIEIGFALNNIDRANDNVLRVRSLIGSRLGEVDSIGGVNEDMTLQYQQTLSSLQDLDYAKSISDLGRKQLDLESAQKSFMKTSQLSLFNYI